MPASSLHAAPPLPSLVVMGVAGCGKSTLAAAVARQLTAPWLEGDALHSDISRTKMATGQPLTDADRAGWLARLCERLQAQAGLVLTCSALKHRYRQQLREAAPGLRFAFLDIDKAEARRRILTRGSHFFDVSLVDSQFDTLEPPLGEAGVLQLDARRPLPALQAEVVAWLHTP